MLVQQVRPQLMNCLEQVLPKRTRASTRKQKRAAISIRNLHPRVLQDTDIPSVMNMRISRLRKLSS